MCLAIPGKIEIILSNDELARSAIVSFSGVKKTINTTFVPDAVVGDYVIVHVGIAISKLNPEQAQQIVDDIDAVTNK